MSRRTSRNNSYTSGISPSGFYIADVVAVDGDYVSVKVPRLGLNNIYENVPFTGFTPAVGDRIWVSFVEGKASHLLGFVGAGDTGTDITEIVAGTNLNGGGSSGSLTISLDDSITLSGDVSAVNVLLSGKVSAEIGSFFTNVGIGTTSPSAELDIRGASNPEIRLQSNDSTDPFLYFGDQVDPVRGGIGFDTSENALLLRGYNNNTRLTIDSGGNVGINNNSPLYTLDVDGNFHVTGTTTADGDVYFQNNALVASFASHTNIDHIWHDDSTTNGLVGTWHFVSDSTYKKTGNSMLEAGGARIPMRLAASTSSNVTISDRTYAGGYIKMTSTSSRTVTVQSRPAGTYKQGDQITVIRENTGAVSFAVSAGSGNATTPTIKSRNGDVSIAYRYSAATLICDSDDGTSWYLIGDLT